MLASKQANAFVVTKECEGDVESGTAPLLAGRRPSSVLQLCAVALLATAIATVVIVVSGGGSNLQAPTSPAVEATARAQSADVVNVYFGNGCFWERQWAYYNVETDASGPFARNRSTFTAYVGYAGGQDPPDGGSAVCYHTGDSRDYSRLGAAEAVQVSLDAGAVEAQVATLSRDFFESFTGPEHSRARPDPMDRGRPYRSFVGLPGGVNSPLYAIVVKQNKHGMALKEGTGGDADELNTIWVYDTATFPFYHGEVYHQNHCNFFPSAGMPYPDDYTETLWKELQASGRYVPTGCPEVAWNHFSCF